MLSPWFSNITHNPNFKTDMWLPEHSNISDYPDESRVPALRLIDGQLNQVKEVIDEQLADCSESVRQLLEHVNIHGGKMLRAGLVLLAGEAVGNITNQHILTASIVEIIHNATLLHDDVIDEGQKRRGTTTVNSLCGNESAVLLGDILLSKVFKMCTALEPRVASAIAAIALRICEGELRQTIQRYNWQLSESEYIDIITEKSASFFSGCCYLGAILADAIETEAESLSRFGRNIGIAFQITDDLLDIIGDENKTGKATGSDADKNKLTLAVIHLLATANKKEKDAVRNFLCTKPDTSSITQQALRDTQYEKKSLAKMLRSHGSLEYAQNQAHEFVAKAILSLANVKESGAKDGLIEIAGFVAARAS